MAIVFKNATVYAPEYLGEQDVLVVGNRIEAIGKDMVLAMPHLEHIDAKGLILTPGFIDQHIHIIGGGGEGGPQSRTPELMLSELIACGTSSVVGVCGTDSITRSIEALLAKARALTFEGVSAWIQTSNYAVPSTLLTDSIRKDIFCVPEVLGVKIAMGDHRCSFPTLDELLRIVSDIRIAAMVAGKIGVLHIHLGEIPDAFEMLNAILKRGMPVKHLRPTHCGRCKGVFEGALAFAKEKGGVIDITSGGSSFDTPAKAIEIAFEEGVPVDLITMSTDGHGSIPRFDKKGIMIGLGTAAVDSNLKVIQILLASGMKPERVLPLVTSNVATQLALPAKGFIREGFDADICVFDQHFILQSLMAKGRFLSRNKEACVKGMFEE